MYDLGDVVELSITITDADGVAANATSVTCTITRPDGVTTDDATVTNDSTGAYSTAYTPTTAGHYSVHWVGTGTNASAFTDSFDVAGATVPLLLSLSDAKAALNLTGTTHDAELRDYLEAATDLIERTVGPVVPRTITETVTARRGALRLTRTPLVSVTSITSATTPTYTVAVDDLIVGQRTGIVVIANDVIPSDVYTVVYVAGLTTPIPARFRQAARLLVQHMWQTQRGSASPGKNRINEATAVGMSYTMPNRVLELLQADAFGPLVG